MSNREKIEKYFNGELNPYELEQLLREIQSNAALSKLYLEYQTAIQSIQEAGKATLKDRLDSIGKQIDKRKQIKKAFISAIVILGFGFSIYLYIDYSKNIKEESPGTLEPKPEKQLEIALIDSLNVTDSLQVDQLKESKERIAYQQSKEVQSPTSNNEKYDKLYNEFYTPFRDESLEPSARGDIDTDPIMKFKQLYWNEKYFEATIAYERLQEAAKNNDNLKFQYAMCLLEIKSYKLAESELHHIVKNENTRYYEEAQYYLALVLIKNQKVKMPKMILDEISNNNLNPYRIMAKSILKKL
ncbi:MAG: hypothetical protein IPO45_14050 [Saprospiraceae bacterium]|jgi:hypothetical protein|uniref:hypothetical protein n=1 Tax=Candidatus Brachybacter algidus TaxID=2982024 RepID=UPI001B420D5A|nr:hypothetical protein [Candidatus Brachybacter algidus]MBP7304816.1 hypothetical protein [Saprospiraceae bacterium]MBK6448882.1 hypothetical protein [Candidatus Brachybacter algidus]MBK7603792.1 hypothetical protein [Candidatus Brachybacter algidus]MBK8357214.1 hypothetical protein [Candidatus Brachybacter algidus]MBK8601600.1 hypothetical protein [Candidatus Brachybacter algidus]